MNASTVPVGQERLVRCPLCGGRFPGRESCPSGCPLSKSCRTLCCPYCDYRFVEESVLVGFLGKLFRGRRA